MYSWLFFEKKIEILIAKRETRCLNKVKKQRCQHHDRLVLIVPASSEPIQSSSSEGLGNTFYFKVLELLNGAAIVGLK